MALTTLTVEIASPAKPKVTEKVELLVDSGAIYSVLPQAVLKRLGIKPIAIEEFRLADGSKITRKEGWSALQMREARRCGRRDLRQAG